MKIITNSQINLIGIAGWRLIVEEPRHNTFHNALVDSALNCDVTIQYLGLQENVPTDWIRKLWPNSILKKYPYLSIANFRRAKQVITSNKKTPTVLYIFEGSLSWFFLLSIYTLTSSKLTVVCNLFSSSKYRNLILNSDSTLKLRYKILFRILSQFKHSILTFDTQLMTNLVSSKFPKLRIERFPVTSSFPYMHSEKPKSHHQQVLVNLRSFPLDRLHKLMQNSCSECRFTFPRGPLAQPSLEDEFSKYPNALFDVRNIPVTEYMAYFDKFDYTVLLYLPSIDASGKLLDAITRKLAVSIPQESSEWVEVAQKWGASNTFGWDSIGITEFGPFNHPVFTCPTVGGVPDFTPTRTLNALQAFYIHRQMVGSRRERLNSWFAYLLLSCHTLAAFILNSFTGLFNRLQKLL